MKGIVNKPQFDTEIFKAGIAIHIEGYKDGIKYRSECKIDTAAIITKSTPLELRIHYYNVKNNELEDMVIEVDKVVGGKFEITLLKGE